MKSEATLAGKSWVAVIVFLLGSGCEFDFEPSKHTPPDDLAVNAVLVFGQSRQRILITTVAHVDSFRLNFVSGAQVEVDSFAFQELSQDSIHFAGTAQRWIEFYNYYRDGLTLQPGREYGLRIQAGERLITGQTRAPDDFQIRNEGRRIYWTSARASLYIVKVADAEYITSDTTVFYYPGDGFTPGIHTVTISACDDHYAQFVLKLTEQSGIDNAYGVCGSVLEKTASIHLP